MGIEGSNSEEAARRVAQGFHAPNIELRPLTSSQGVVDALQRKEVDYGIVAIKNSIGGLVEETFNAFRDVDVEYIASEVLSIEHFLYVYKESIHKKQIKKIASHPQAIKQCLNNLYDLFSEDLEFLFIDDTAASAKKLYEGELDKDTAVLCRRNAGDSYGLHLLYENLEDRKDNKTEFQLIRIKES